jgi:hypothetical protein
MADARGGALKTFGGCNDGPVEQPLPAFSKEDRDVEVKG